MAKEFLRKVASVQRSHTEQLQSFGYQDVYVEVANGFNPTTKVSSIYGMQFVI